MSQTQKQKKTETHFKMRFEVFSKTIKIKDDEYTLRPLSGRYLPKLYEVASKLGKGDDEEDILANLNEEVVKKLHDLALQTFVTAYPQEDKDKIDLFVSQNLLEILPVLIELNMGSEVTEEAIKSSSKKEE